MAAGYPGVNATYVPSFEQSGKLISGFSRNPKKFKLPNYCKLVPVKKNTGYFLRITAEEAARVINSNLSDFVWQDGHEAPMGNDNLESFEYIKFMTQRYAYAFNLGDMAVNQADWPIMPVQSQVTAQKAMTARTIGTLSVLTTGANWGSSTDTATNLGGGKWDVSSATNKYILKTFNAVWENVLKNTLGVVEPDDLVCVINPHDARLMAESEEIRDFLKQSQYALPQVTYSDKKQTGNYGLPEHLYGVKLIVENAVRVTSKKGATKAVTYCLPNASALFLTKTEGVVGMEGIADFSTAQIFIAEEMTVETLADVNNRRQVGRIVENFVSALVAPSSGYYVTATTG